MMMNIFNIFDPSTGMLFSLNWLSILTTLIFFPLNFWLISSRLMYFFKMILNYIFEEFSIILKKSFSNMIFFISLFYFILLNNFMSLFPYIFPTSSHMSICLSLSLNLWLSIMLFSWMNFYMKMFTYLLPSNTPQMLSPFMILIEFISLMIRPITLSIRLSANMITGHLLLTLMGHSTQQSNNIFILMISISIQMILSTMEIMISIIQSYVFSILSLLYSKEI